VACKVSQEIVDFPPSLDRTRQLVNWSRAIRKATNQTHIFRNGSCDQDSKLGSRAQPAALKLHSGAHRLKYEKAQKQKWKGGQLKGYRRSEHEKSQKREKKPSLFHDVKIPGLNRCSFHFPSCGIGHFQTAQRASISLWQKQSAEVGHRVHNPETSPCESSNHMKS
jgi:hypothetical protein